MYIYIINNKYKYGNSKFKTTKTKSLFSFR